LLGGDPPDRVLGLDVLERAEERVTGGGSPSPARARVGQES
jgi:hypothetical protein